MTETSASSLWGKVKRGLFMTHTEIIDKLAKSVEARHGIDETVLESLEESLLAADAGVEITAGLMARVRERLRLDPALGLGDLKALLRREVEAILGATPAAADAANAKPHVVVMVGVNGAGKTTTAAKLAGHYRRQGRKVLLAAADTFRAAAIEQLDLWGRRLGVEVIQLGNGADPAAVVFDALAAARKRGADTLIIDTAGRLHTKHNLMAELGKISRVIDRELAGTGSRDVYLVLDATTGQNAVRQAREFLAVAGLSGIVLTKLDGTAKGGVILAIVRDLGIPVCFIGVGEQADDLLPFEPATFAAALFE